MQAVPTCAIVAFLCWPPVGTATHRAHCEVTLYCCWVASGIDGDYFSFVAHPSDQSLKRLH